MDIEALGDGENYAELLKGLSALEKIDQTDVATLIGTRTSSDQYTASSMGTGTSSDGLSSGLLSEGTPTTVASPSDLSFVSLPGEENNQSVHQLSCLSFVDDFNDEDDMLKGFSTFNITPCALTPTPTGTPKEDSPTVANNPPVDESEPTTSRFKKPRAKSSKRVVFSPKKEMPYRDKFNALLSPLDDESPKSPASRTGRTSPTQTTHASTRGHSRPKPTIPLIDSADVEIIYSAHASHPSTASAPAPPTQNRPPHSPTDFAPAKKTSAHTTQHTRVKFAADQPQVMPDMGTLKSMISTEKTKSLHKRRRKVMPLHLKDKKDQLRPPDNKRRRGWSASEDQRLRHAVESLGASASWRDVAELVGTRVASQCAQRWRKNVRPELSQVKRGTWDVTEDNKLRALVLQHGSAGLGIWEGISEGMNRQRNPKQCRERWNNFLDPTLKIGNWTEEEDGKLMSLYAELGSKWAKISRQLSGRTSDRVKQRYKTLAYKAKYKSI